MEIVTTRLKSVKGSPIQFGAYHNTEKKSKETSDAYEKRTWRGRCHERGGQLYIPAAFFKNAFAAAAKYENLQIPGKGKCTYTKHAKAGIQVATDLVLPVTKKEVEGAWVFGSSTGTPGAGKRVMKCFPTVREWEGDVEWMILDSTITVEVFERFLMTAGLFIGLGVWRPANGGEHGRFIVESIA